MSNLCYTVIYTLHYTIIIPYVMLMLKYYINLIFRLHIEYKPFSMLKANIFSRFFVFVFSALFCSFCCCSATFRGHKHVRVAIQYGQLLLSLCPPPSSRAHTHTHTRCPCICQRKSEHTHTCFPPRSLLLEKLNLAFCNLTKKK